MDAHRVMLVDDHTVLRAGLRMLIDAQEDLHVVAEADDVGPVAALVGSTRPDVLVLDLTLPGGSGLKLIEELRKSVPETRILVLTMHDEPAYVRATLAAGALGYVVKTVGEDELLDAIRTVRRGRIHIDLDDPARTANVFHALVPGADAKGTAPVPALSAREKEVLRLLGQGLTNQAVAERLEISPKTVATYRARIGEKLGLRSTADFVQYARDLGPDDRSP